MYTGQLIRFMLTLLITIVCFASGQVAATSNTTDITKIHGFALYEDLKYPSNWKHLDYANPNAPKGGHLKLMGVGTFDTLNPYLLKGTSPRNTPGLYLYGFGELHDTLLAGTDALRPSGDEPQSAYGLIAETLEYPKDYSWVIFNLREAARFHDGHPITADDVVFSFNTLKEKGHPRFAITYQPIKSAIILNSKKVKFEFEQKYQRQLILRAGELPILPAHYFKKHEFEKTGLTPILGNGPYQIKTFKPGQSLILQRVQDYWAQNLPVNKGLYNFDEIQIDFYRDAAVAFEAFKAGEYDIHIDYVAKNWSKNYQFPAIRKGLVTKAEIPHQQAQGTQAFFFNLRKPLFQDKRVREAISKLFDFEWSNKTLFNNAYTRSNTYFPNSPFTATGLPIDAELAILKPFKNDLPQVLFKQTFELSKTKGSGQIRRQRKQALELLNQAGWYIKNNQLLHNITGEPFVFEQVNQHSASLQRVLLPFQKNLKTVGIEMSIRMVDPAQYKERLDNFDFDMTIFVLPQSLAPGERPHQYFHSDTADIKGNKNYAGIKNPVVDAIIEQIDQTTTLTEVTQLMKALDRVLLWEHYTIPHWYINYHRIAYWNKLSKPKKQPPYILGVQTWWQKQ